MKTTIDIADALLTEAKRVASAEGTTVRELVEDGLRRSLAERRRRRTPFRVRPVTFGGHGLRPELEGASWEQILRLAYEGRGA
ncbi:MAG TPA: type II toxin-antitoxin system VapB family antitoxin [Chloroflexota bacterium]|nr:type II toxin-antitoxin system VapB family antitoxin [Chloroflexota bacterium]